jgi:hypothetical protein
MVTATLDRIGAGDLVLLNDPLGTRPVRVLLATRVAAAAEKVRAMLADPASYGRAMPSFRRVEVLSRQTRGLQVQDLEIGWELEVPLWNLEGKLWLKPRPDGVVLELADGDFAPGLFHITAREDGAGRTALVIEGFANVREANWATRRLTKRSPLAEPAISVAATYVMLKALAQQAERGAYARPVAPMVAPALSTLYGVPVAAAADAFPAAPRVLAVVRSRADGRLARVEVAVPTAASEAAVSARRTLPQVFTSFAGWHKVTPVFDKPNECRDSTAICWAVETDLPFFSLDGTWKIWPRPWRARTVLGDGKGAIMALDVVPGRVAGHSTIVLSQHPRMDRAGYVARKLIAAEPFLEHGLALALTLIDAVALAPALERPP